MVLPQLEELRLRPQVGGVHSHVNGQVADDLDAQVVDVLPQGGPLAVEEELEVAVEVHVLPELPGVALHSLRLSQPDILVGPIQPALHVEMALYRHVEGIVGEPGILFPEGIHRLLVPGKAPLKGLAEDGKPGLIDLSIIHIARLGAPVYTFQIITIQEAVLRQQVQVNKVGVSGEGGKALIGAVTIAGGAQGQKLPVLLTGGMEEIGKGVGLPAQSADAIRGGKGGNREQDSTAAIHRDHPFCNDLPLIVAVVLRFVKKVAKRKIGFWQIDQSAAGTKASHGGLPIDRRMVFWYNTNQLQPKINGGRAT